MSKRGYITRYSLILKKLKKKPYSNFQEIQQFLETQFQFMRVHDDTLEAALSQRTLQRDIRDIRNTFGINIEYSKQEKGYFIAGDNLNNMNFERMMESFEVFHSLQLADDLSGIVHLENRKPQHTEHLYGLIHAIKNKFVVRFTYQKFWEEDSTERVVQPYGLKEFRNRWYLVTKEQQNNKIKTFALDRLSELVITNEHFIADEKFDLQFSFRHSFGIINPDAEEPQEVILSFEPGQGKYVKTLPLHHSQEIIADNETELRVKLVVFVTHDFIMEILSYGAEVKVIKPVSLIRMIKQAHENAYKLYKK